MAESKENLARIRELIGELKSTADRLGTGNDDIEIELLTQQLLEVYREIRKPIKSGQTASAQISSSPIQSHAEKIRSTVTDYKQVHSQAPQSAPKEGRPSSLRDSDVIEKKREKLQKIDHPLASPTENQRSAPHATEPVEHKKETKAEEPKQSSIPLHEKLQSAAATTASLNEKFQPSSKTNLAEKMKLGPISDLKTAISLNQKMSFIRSLFGGDEKEYKKTLGFISDSKNFSEAKFYLQSEIGRKYNWNDNDPSVKEFMELVHRKFL